MKSKSYENTVEAAIPVKIIMDAAQQLDVEYLRSALNDMRANHSMRESAAVLNPNPFINKEQQDLNEAKLTQLDLMLQLAENTQRIKEATLKLNGAKQSVNQMNKLFNF